MTLSILLSLFLLGISIAAYSVRELLYHHKLKWMTNDDGFWGDSSDKRKYARPLKPAPDNWYYRWNDLSYKEKFPLSGTIFVWTTDALHFLQMLLFTFLSLAFTFALGFNWYLLAGIWIGIHLLHLARKIISR